MMTSMTTVAVNQEGAFMNVNIIGNKVFVNGSLLPPVPGAKSSVSLSQVGNRLYVNGACNSSRFVLRCSQMRKCTMCQNHDSCSEQRRRECRVRDYLFFRPTFVGRCDNCGAPLYADSIRYEATIGRQTLELCESCCKKV